MFNPNSSYRIQFHRGFSFDDLDNIIPYLQQLGVCTVYASPIFEAVPGSMHGYDSVNPTLINPEIGTEEQLRQINKKLKDAGICWLQDIVPNHMAYHPKNKWLMDVLEKGQQSMYAPYFDIAWNSTLFKGKLMVPFLGKTLRNVVNDGELKLDYEDGRLVLKYFDSGYPLSPRTYEIILGKAEQNDAIKNVLEQIGGLRKTEEKNALKKGWDELLFQFGNLLQNDVVKTSVQNVLDSINSDPQKVFELAVDQEYRLCHWQETDGRINYRRFFTVNNLICVNIHDEAVFNGHHAFIRQLTEENIFQGLRIDHVDGLYNPTEYLRRLREWKDGETYLVVEKILEPGEDLPNFWPIEGNTGYDFLAMVNNLFTNKKSEIIFTEYYEQLTNDYESIQQHLNEKKSNFLREYMGGEMDNIYRLFIQLNIADKKYMARIPADDLKSVMGEFLVHCPVYRFYGTSFPLNEREEMAVRDIFNRIRKSGESPEAIYLLESVLLLRPKENNEELNKCIAQFYQRCMQLTAPLMAKGVEDTLMYTYNRFIAHNEVGDSPEAFGYTTDEFHRLMQNRRHQWPLSLNGTSTHDTKRGEDVRTRLNVLTDLGEEWIAKVEEWRQMNKDLKQNNVPDENDEYFIYQCLMGNYPMPGEGEFDFAERIQAYLEKALREAKVHSNWTTPDAEYETATKNFAVSLLDKNKPFWKSFEAFHQSIVDHGIINSLSQVVLKFTCPGVPDVYQGCEFWDLSFVDPDNRLAVDYEERMAAFGVFAEMNAKDLLQHLWETRYNAYIKLWLIQQLLELRNTHSELFAEGDYLPLQVEGTYKAHVFAFARRYKGVVYVTAIPLHTAEICKEQGKDFFALNWKDTIILLPKGLEREAENIIAQTTPENKRGLMVKELFNEFPVAVIKTRQIINERGAGILVHISSLPSLYGIGDLGPEAKAFADFLYRNGQKYWQLLPINPTEAGQGYSPYSALSSKAGYPLLISPDWLMSEGLLTMEDVRVYQLPQEAKVDFAGAERAREELLNKAFKNFSDLKASPMQEGFRHFIKEEREWLDDFALFMLLKKHYEGKPWFEWPDEYRTRQEDALKKLRDSQRNEIRKIKWLQFIFAKQWHELKNYCNSLRIKLIGDMPFYISYDSADVWANQEIFSVDEQGKRTAMAGVPPDAFSADGQLWGMPVFKWDILKETGYKWWIKRLQKNIELFDLVRLDHFRAFSAYWEVPAGEPTARNGSWKPGPRHDFFKTIEKELRHVPFIAEDLGDIDDDVFDLRDTFHLPGMKVLQFAFGEDMPKSYYIPHNYDKNAVVYSGTHDNNTTIGWYRTEASEDIKQRINQYAGTNVNAENIHQVFARMAYSSIANIAILPIQDVLGLDENARMNKPSSSENNWAWRLTPNQINQNTDKFLQELTRLYNRE